MLVPFYLQNDYDYSASHFLRCNVTLCRLRKQRSLLSYLDAVIQDMDAILAHLLHFRR
jgi:hypothetical protein